MCKVCERADLNMRANPEEVMAMDVIIRSDHIDLSSTLLNRIAPIVAMEHNLPPFPSMLNDEELMRIHAIIIGIAVDRLNDVMAETLYTDYRARME